MASGRVRGLLAPVVVGTLALSGISWLARDRGGAAPVEPGTRLCVRVVDGDTVELEGGERVRYIGIDTPETVHPRKPVQRMGREASEANRRLVEGKRVRLEYDVERTDKYGRTLAYVWAGGRMVNEELVRTGLAQVSTYPPNVKYVERFLAAQREARDLGAGLWSESEEPPSPPRAPGVESPVTPAQDVVYVAETGKKFHATGCQYVARSCIPMKRSEAIAAGYGPCSRCGP